jgi:putative heme utilization carrier protein HutX
MNLKEQIEEKLKSNESEHIRNLASQLQVSEAEVAANLPEKYRREIPVTDFEKVWNRVREWECALFFVDKGSVITEVKGRLPQGVWMGPMFNVGTKESMLHAHIFTQNMASVFMINKPLFNKESLSIAFYDKEGAPMFALYAGRDDTQSIISSVKEQFEQLWAEYSV